MPKKATNSHQIDLAVSLILQESPPFSLEQEKVIKSLLGGL